MPPLLGGGDQRVSREAMEWALATVTGDPTRKLILAAIGKHAGRDGAGAWASTETLAEYGECSTRTAQRHLAALLEVGFIREGDQSVIPEHISKRRRPIVYDLAMDAETAVEWAAAERVGRRAGAAAAGAVAGRKGAPRRAEVRAATCPRGVTDDTPQPESGVTDDTPPEHARGVTDDTSQTRGVTSDTPRETPGERQGVSHGVSSGVSSVTPKQEKKPRTRTIPQRPADAERGELDLGLPPSTPTDPDPVQVLVGVYVRAVEAQGGVVRKGRSSAVGARAKQLLADGIDMERLIPAFENSGRAGNLDFDRHLAAPLAQNRFAGSPHRPAQGHTEHWNRNGDFFAAGRN